MLYFLSLKLNHKDIIPGLWNRSLGINYKLIISKFCELTILPSLNIIC